MNPGAAFEISVMCDNTVANSFWRSVGFVTPVYTNYFFKDSINNDDKDEVRF